MGTIGGLDKVVVKMREVVSKPDAIALGRFSKTLAPRCALWYDEMWMVRPPPAFKRASCYERPTKFMDMAESERSVRARLPSSRVCL